MLTSILVNSLNYKEMVFTFRNIYVNANDYEFSFFPRTVCDWNRLYIDALLAQNLDMFKQNIVHTIHVMPYNY